MGLEEVDLAVKGQLVDTRGVARAGEVFVRDGRIVGCDTEMQAVARQTIDVGDAFVLPGIVDAHVHSLSHDGEGIAAATSAAAAGGVTTIVEMPYDSAGPIDSPEKLESKRKLVDTEAVIDVALLATVAPGGGWKAVPDLVSEGACGFKVSLFDTDPRRFPRIDDSELLDVLESAAAHGRVVCVHAENNEIVKTNILKLQTEHRMEVTAHADSRPPVAETQGVLTALEAAHWTGASVHLCHLSLSRSVTLAEWYRSSGTDVSIETCPHYLLMTAEDLFRIGARGKINPPLRSQDDQSALWSALGSGLIDIVASDHAPWPLSFKTHSDVFANHSGVPGVETMAPMVLSAALQQSSAAFAATIAALTVRPAQRFGLGDRKGQLKPGYDADLTVFDSNCLWAIDESLLHSNAGWSPYNGRVVQGRVVMTISKGRVVWDGGNLSTQPGIGRTLEHQAGGR